MEKRQYALKYKCYECTHISIFKTNTCNYGKQKQIHNAR